MIVLVTLHLFGMRWTTGGHNPTTKRLANSIACSSQVDETRPVGLIQVGPEDIAGKRTILSKISARPFWTADPIIHL